jgi:hypothetical protein
MHALSTLLTASFSFVSAPLAKLYGMNGITAATPTRTAMPPERRGLLTHATILATTAHPAQTSPVFRGKLVREGLLCQKTPSPPDRDAEGNPVDTSPPRTDPTQTTRQRYQTHLDKAFCAGCHRLLNPIGFAFERYDSLGKLRERDNGQTIDARGELVATRDIDGTFDGVPAQWSGGASDVRHTWIPGVPNLSHHGIAHDTPPGFTVKDQIEALVKIDSWYAEQVAYLCTKLDGTANGQGGTLLDDTAVLWTHEQSNGGNHSRRDMPYVLAGSCGGYFKTGQSLDFGGREAAGKSGPAHNGLLLSLAHAMGAPLATFGDPEYSKGPLGELAA